MYDYPVKVLGLSKFAEVTGISTANLSKLKDADYYPRDIAEYPLAASEPEPQTEEEKKERRSKRLVSDPVYLAEDVETFIIKSNIKHKKRAIRKLHALYSTTSIMRKNFTIILRGIGRLGKSLLSNQLSKERDLLLKLFVGRGDRKTVCSSVYRYWRTSQQTQARFTTDFTKNWDKIKDDDLKEDILKIKQEYNKLIEIQAGRIAMPITDERISEWVSIVEIVSSLIEEYSKKNNEHFNTFVTVDTEAGKYAQYIMNKVNTQMLTVVDTPGADGEAEVCEIGYATPDINLLMFGDRPGTELNTCFRQIAENCKESIASAPVLFLYNGQDFDLSNYDNYEEILDETKRVLKDLNNYLDPFRKGSIAGTGISFFSPIDHCVGYLNLSSREGKHKSEDDVFFNYLAESIYERLPEVTKDNLEDEIEEAINDAGISIEKAREFAVEIISNIPCHEWNGDKSPSEVFEASGKRYRTYSKDCGKVAGAISRAKQREFLRLYEYFIGTEKKPSVLTEQNYPEKWQSLIIKYIYVVLSSEVNSNYGLGVGEHQWENQPPVTMLAEESLFAEEVIRTVSDRIGTEASTAYVKVLNADHGIESGSWNRVSVDHTKEADMKLLLISKSVRHMVKDLDEAILDTYVHGLLMMAEYKMMEFFKAPESEIEQMVLVFSF